MSSDVALRVQNLTKRYDIRHLDHDHVTLTQALLHRVRHPRGGRRVETFWAVNDISLEVPRGEVLGVIGHNGAGKSTLLKILSRITPPTAGRVEVFGRIGSLLEVGTGFHPELTGRENVYLNGAILGMRSKEIDRQFDDIVEFSGVQKFLDTPVKRYSSGMYVRLAFAVAAHLDCEILLLDEVLAVGDPDFQQRSVAQIKAMARDGRTVLFVSHNRDLVADLTTRAIALDRGRIVDSGPSLDVLDRQQRIRRSAGAFQHLKGLGTATRFVEASASAERSHDGQARIRVTMAAESTDGCHGWRPNFTFRTGTGNAIGSTFGPVCSAVRPGGRAEVSVISEPLPLAPGAYSVDLSLSTLDAAGSAFDLADVVKDACVFEVPELREGAWDPEWGFLNFTTTPVRDAPLVLDHVTSTSYRGMSQ